MKNKYVLFVALIACFVTLVLAKPVEDTCIAVALSNENVETEISSNTDFYNCFAVLGETANHNIPVRTISLSGNQNSKTFERQPHNILSVRKNLKIEFTVENYIFFVEYSACYLDNFSELRRLNI